MTFTFFEWRSADSSTPLEKIYYDPREQSLVLRFRDVREASSYEKVVKGFDPRCTRDGIDIFLSAMRARDPQKCGDFLIEKKMIDRPCYDELQMEMRKYGRGLEL